MTKISIWPIRENGDISFDELKRDDIILIVFNGKISHPDSACLSVVSDASPTSSYIVNLEYAYIKHNNYTYYKVESYREAYEEILKHCY